MRISTVLFDADGVLQFRGPIYEHFAQRYGWSEQKLRDFFQRISRERPDFDDGLTSDVDLTLAMSAALRDWGWALPPEIFIQDLLRYGLVPDPDALALVADLRSAGVRCGLATNQPRLQGRYMREDLGYDGLFDHHFYSYLMGVAKPDPAFFDATLATLDVTAAQVLFIDDREDNVTAARDCGLHAVVHRPGDRLRDHLARYALAV
jgi:putative hydrolase of the HAD superfamily